MKQTDSEEEALQQLQKHAANYAQRITIYKIDGRAVKREVAEYDQKRSVEYADYKPGMLYVSVYEVFPAETDAGLS